MQLQPDGSLDTLTQNWVSNLGGNPLGAAVGLWQAGTHYGAQLVNEHGTPTWNELLTDDTAAAAQFYAMSLGIDWK